MLVARKSDTGSHIGQSIGIAAPVTPSRSSPVHEFKEFNMAINRSINRLLRRELLIDPLLTVREATKNVQPLNAVITPRHLRMAPNTFAKS